MASRQYQTIKRVTIIVDDEVALKTKRGWLIDNKYKIVLCVPLFKQNSPNGKFKMVGEKDLKAPMRQYNQFETNLLKELKIVIEKPRPKYVPK